MSIVLMLAPFVADKKVDTRKHRWYWKIIGPAIIVIFYSMSLAALIASLFAMWNPELVAAHTHSSAGHIRH